MLSLNTLFLLGLAATSATACVTAHVDMVNDPIGGDSVTLQIWDNENRVCDDSQTINAASYDTVYSFDRGGDGIRADVTHNAKLITYHHDPYNYHVDLTIVDEDGPETYDCEGTDDHPIECSDYEATFTVNYGNCPGKAQPQLCDHRGRCDDGQGGGPGGAE